VSIAATIAEPTGRQLAARLLLRAWLLLLALMVFAMVVVGGATRLTGSGLSITEWAPVTGVVPPLTEEAWEAELEKYRQIPQYQLVNRGMSLDEFKAIYWWEWGHRLLGRLVGVVFVVPFLWFWLTGRLERRLMPWVIGAFLLGGLQGVLGWYMVASGLVERVTVSQYRLAAHLTLAAIIFAYLVWLADSLRPRAPHPPAPPRIGWGGAVILALVFLQVAFGALVAGLHAGLTHQTWPLIDGRLIPPGLADLDPWWRNTFENMVAVQFNHRLVAYLLVLAAFAHTVDCIRLAGQGQAARRAVTLFVAILAQSGLGVATLLAGVPLGLGLMHQAGAMVVLAIAVVHAYRLIGTGQAEGAAAARAGPGRPAQA
jgi:heme a synthase